MKRLLTSIAVAAALALPAFSILAGRDEVQNQMMQRLHESKQKLAAAEAARGAERKRLMGEHMKMMSEVMTQMQQARPKADMTPEQMKEWISEHMKLMDDMMGQMMREHHMLMAP